MALDENLRAELLARQFTLVDGALHLYEVEDPDTLDERRAAVGLEPFAEYQRRIQSLSAREGADEHHDNG